MKFINSIVMTVLILGLFSCKCHKDAATGSSSSSQSSSANSADQSMNSTTNTTNSNTTTTTQTTVSSNTNKTQGDTVPAVYRVVVSFISIGEGTDANARPMLDKYVQQFMDGTSKRIVNDAHAWGREGESDICFTLDNLTPEEQVRFVNGLKEVFKGRELVHIIENKKNTYRK